MRPPTARRGAGARPTTPRRPGPRSRRLRAHQRAARGMRVCGMRAALRSPRHRRGRNPARTSTSAQECTSRAAPARAAREPGLAGGCPSPEHPLQARAQSSRTASAPVTTIITSSVSQVLTNRYHGVSRPSLLCTAFASLGPPAARRLLRSPAPTGAGPQAARGPPAHGTPRCRERTRVPGGGSSRGGQCDVAGHHARPWLRGARRRASRGRSGGGRGPRGGRLSASPSRPAPVRRLRCGTLIMRSWLVCCRGVLPWFVQSQAASRGRDVHGGAM